MFKVFLSNLGCYKNLVDAEVILGRLAAAGAKVCAEPEGADVVVVNTCCFIREATRESSKAIRDALRLKQSGKVRLVIVTGCMAQRHGERLFENFRGVDAISPLHRRDELPRLCAHLLGALEPRRGRQRANTLDAARAQSIVDRGRFRLTASHFAYLRIAEGCDNWCSYCVVPSLRGPYRSKPLAEILREARELVNSGARELILIAQDSAGFGTDLSGESMTHQLLESLAALRGIEWLRLLYAHPASITDNLVRTLRQVKKVVKYLDVPIQHASDRLLRAMRRRTTRADLKRLVARLRERVPGIALRTTAIVGFPGETTRDFEELLKFVQWARFERLGAFMYSREPGTAAAQMTGQVPVHEKKARLRELMMLQAENSLRYHHSLVDTNVAAIVDSCGCSLERRSGGRVNLVVERVPALPPHPAHRPHHEQQKPLPASLAPCCNSTPQAMAGLYLGRTFADAPEVDCTLTIEGSGLTPGDILTVRITAATTYDLHGIAVRT